MFEFIPQLLFIGLFFGWFIVLIIAKWINQDPATAYNLINTLIGIPLGLGEVATGESALDNPSLQTTLQQCILLISVVTVPIMLLGKPLFLSGVHAKKISVGAI